MLTDLLLSSVSRINIENLIKEQTECEVLSYEDLEEN